MGLKALPMVRERGECCELPKVDREWARQASELLKAVGDPTRLTMLAALWRANSSVCICDFTSGLDLSQPTISHHMARLKDAGLVESEKRGIWVHYRLRDDLAPATKKLLANLLA